MFIVTRRKQTARFLSRVIVEDGVAMTLSEFMMKLILVIALCAAAIVAVLWLAFALKELWQMHTLAQLRRTHGANEVDTRTAPFER
jgi:hypothetical protein